MPVENYNDVGTHHSRSAGFDIEHAKALPAMTFISAWSPFEDKVAGNSRLLRGVRYPAVAGELVDRHGSGSPTQIPLPLRGVP